MAGGRGPSGEAAQLDRGAGGRPVVDDTRDGRLAVGRERGRDARRLDDILADEGGRVRLQSHGNKYCAGRSRGKRREKHRTSWPVCGGGGAFGRRCTLGLSCEAMSPAIAHTTIETASLEVKTAMLEAKMM